MSACAEGKRALSEALGPALLPELVCIVVEFWTVPEKVGRFVAVAQLQPLCLLIQRWHTRPFHPHEWGLGDFLEALQRSPSLTGCASAVKDALEWYDRQLATFPWKSETRATMNTLTHQFYELLEERVTTEQFSAMLAEFRRHEADPSPADWTQHRWDWNRSQP